MKKKQLKKLMLTILLTCSFTLMSACDSNAVSDNDVSQNTNVALETGVDMDQVLFSLEDIDITLEETYIYLIQYLFNNSVKAEDITDEQFAQIVSATVEEMKVENVEYKLAKVTEGVDVSENDLTSAGNTGNYFYEYFGKAFFDKYGIDKNKVDEMFEKQVYIEKLKTKALSDATEDYTNDYNKQYAELPFFSVYYVLFPSVKYDEEGNPIQKADGSAETYTDEEMQEQLSKANELREKAIQNVNEGIAGGKLEELAKEYGVDSASGIEHNFKGAYNDELNSVIEGLKDGDISEVIKTEAGYMIVRMDNADDKEFKEYSIKYMAQQSAETFYPKLQESWLSASGAQNIQVDTSKISKDLLIEICQEMNDKGFSITGGTNG